MDLEGGVQPVGEPRQGDRVRVLVVGDAGVGKSSLVHLVCRGLVLRGAGATVGCQVDATLIQCAGSPWHVELVEVGGGERFRPARGVFFIQQFHGVLFVHDLSNRKSLDNLRRWRQALKAGMGGSEHTHADTGERDGSPTYPSTSGRGCADPYASPRFADPWRSTDRSPGGCVTRRQSSGLGPGPGNLSGSEGNGASSWVEAAEMVRDLRDVAA